MVLEFSIGFTKLKMCKVSEVELLKDVKRKIHKNGPKFFIRIESSIYFCMGKLNPDHPSVSIVLYCKYKVNKKYKQQRSVNTLVFSNTLKQ